MAVEQRQWQKASQDSTRGSASNGTAVDQLLRLDERSLLEDLSKEDVEKVLAKLAILQTAANARLVQLNEKTKQYVKGAAMLCKESYTGLTTDELSFEKGDVLTFIESDESGWAFAEGNERSGWFPLTYVMPKPQQVTLPSPRSRPTDARKASTRTAVTLPRNVAAQAGVPPAAAAPASPVVVAPPVPAVVVPTQTTPSPRQPVSAGKSYLGVEETSIIADKKRASQNLAAFFGAKAKPGSEADAPAREGSSSPRPSRKGEKKDDKKDGLMNNLFGTTRGKGAKPGDSPVFGQPLAQALSQKKAKAGMQVSFIPHVVLDLVRFLDRPDRIQCVGLFRLSPGQREMLELRGRFVSPSESVDVEAACSQYAESVHVAASLLKNFFMSLPEPLFPFVLYDEIHTVVSAGVLTAPVVKCIVDKLPPINRMTLGALMSLLKKVCDASAVNKMSPGNLGIVWGPNLIRPRVETPETMIRKTDSAFVEAMLEHYDQLQL
jgi:hypothetical protein